MAARDPNRRYNLLNESPARGDKVRYLWSRETDGTYILTRTIYKRDGRSLWDIQVEGLSKEEYFRRRLAHPDDKDTFYI